MLNKIDKDREKRIKEMARKMICLDQDSLLIINVLAEGLSARYQMDRSQRERSKNE